MADEELELDVSQAKGNKMTNILLIVLILLVLAMGGAGAWYFFLRGDTSAKNDEVAAVEKAPLHYLNLVPEFVVNFGPGSKVRYLQVDLQVATRDEHALAAMTTNMPVIRNDILLLLSGQSYEVLKTRAGKEALQKQILDKLNTIITSVEADEQHAEEAPAEQKDTTDEKTTGNTETDVVAGPIENVYFTSFIMQ